MAHKIRENVQRTDIWFRRCFLPRPPEKARRVYSNLARVIFPLWSAPRSYFPARTMIQTVQTIRNHYLQIPSAATIHRPCQVSFARCLPHGRSCEWSLSRWTKWSKNLRKPQLLCPLRQLIRASSRAVAIEKTIEPLDLLKIARKSRKWQPSHPRQLICPFFLLPRRAELREKFKSLEKLNANGETTWAPLGVLRFGSLRDKFEKLKSLGNT